MFKKTLATIKNYKYNNKVFIHFNGSYPIDEETMSDNTFELRIVVPNLSIWV